MPTANLFPPTVLVELTESAITQLLDWDEAAYRTSDKFEDDGIIAVVDASAILGALTAYRDGEYDEHDILNLDPVSDTGMNFKSLTRGFIDDTVKELRKRICSGRDKSADLSGLSAKGAAAALASSIAGQLGSHNPVMIGVIATMLVVIGKAAGASFCRMTDEEISGAVDDLADRRT
jgi:hypothetical protein